MGHCAIGARNPLDFSARAVVCYCATVLFGLIAATDARIWVENGVDFGRGRNLLMAGVTLILGTGAYTITIGNFPLTGITLATLAAILLYQVLRDPVTPEAREDAGAAIAPADSALSLLARTLAANSYRF